MSDFTNLSDCMAQAASVSRKKTTSALERRRSTVQTNSWDRYRILFPHSILEQFSTEFGQCETADKAGDNCMIPDKRLLEISRRVWPATAVFANMQHVEQVLHQQALYNQYQKGEPITFEEFLRFFQNFFELTKELHPNWGYDDEFTFQVEMRFKELANDQNKIKCSQIFDVLSGVGQVLGQDEQKQVLSQIKNMEDGSGLMDLRKFMQLLRRVDDLWEFTERKDEIRIIDETEYSEQDLDNLRQLFQAFAVQDPTDTRRMFLSVGQCRDMLRGIGLTIDMEKTQQLKAILRPFFNDHELVDFVGFCRAIRVMEKQNFANIGTVMNSKSKDGAPIDVASIKRSFFQRKAMSTSSMNMSP
eukprot:GEMP01025871.1.p1 GENE.GEMP01025871.1~~GEMP01025871.1.p1  ORF type:complete len:359 (+),score=62.77 GEMP01025871.1:35-1111(+)